MIAIETTASASTQLYLLPAGSVAVLEHADGTSDAPHLSESSLISSHAAPRMERATYDLLGIASTATDKRGWLRHGGWPETVFPLRRDVDGKAQYPFEVRAVSVCAGGR